MVVKLGVQTITNIANPYILESNDLFASGVNSAMVAFFIIVLLLKLDLLTAQLLEGASLELRRMLSFDTEAVVVGSITASSAGLVLLMLFLLSPFVRRRKTRALQRPPPEEAVARRPAAGTAGDGAAGRSGSSRLPDRRTLPAPVLDQHLMEQLARAAEAARADTLEHMQAERLERKDVLGMEEAWESGGTKDAPEGRMRHRREAEHRSCTSSTRGTARTRTITLTPKSAMRSSTTRVENGRACASCKAWAEQPRLRARRSWTADHVMLCKTR